ncbi:hypothetical protein UJ101_02412 [Flavobacteriaceae bacterium UJ101]|nr:hypothetical protein UJ101_02412 [Flavobacteriaceae bacterium UJ101]
MKKIVYIILIFCSILGHSQKSIGGKPKLIDNLINNKDKIINNKSIDEDDNFIYDENKYLNGINNVLLPSIGNQQIQQKVIESPDIEDNVYGKVLDFKINYFDKAKKFETQDEFIYLARFTSESAIGLQFYFADFYLPKGAQLYIYNEDSLKILGGYTSDNNPDLTKLSKESRSMFGTQPIFSKEVYIELSIPKKVKEEPTIKFNHIVHIFKNFNNNSDSSRSEHCYDPIYDQWKNTEHKKAIKSVGLILFPLRTNNQNYMGTCTGSLINNTKQDGTPYFLTANHCFNTSNDIYTFPEEMLIIFNDEKRSANDNSGLSSNNNSVLGAKFLDKSSAYDYALLELDTDDNTLADYKVCYIGWDTSELKSSDDYYGIHHPEGSDKKLSKLKNTGATASEWISNWKSGILEPGSSGSPLVNPSGKLVGVLSKGPRYNLLWTGKVEVERDENGNPVRFQGCSAPNLYRENLYLVNHSKFPIAQIRHIIAENKLSYTSLGAYCPDDDLHLGPDTVGDYIDPDGDGDGDGDGETTMLGKDRLFTADVLVTNNASSTWGKTFSLSSAKYDISSSNYKNAKYFDPIVEGDFLIGASEIDHTWNYTFDIPIFKINDDKILTPIPLRVNKYGEKSRIKIHDIKNNVIAITIDSWYPNYENVFLVYRFVNDKWNLEFERKDSRFDRIFFNTTNEIIIEDFNKHFIIKYSSGRWNMHSKEFNFDIYNRVRIKNTWFSIAEHFIDSRRIINNELVKNRMVDKLIKNNEFKLIESYSGANIDENEFELFFLNKNKNEFFIQTIKYNNSGEVVKNEVSRIFSSESSSLFKIKDNSLIFRNISNNKWSLSKLDKINGKWSNEIIKINTDFLNSNGINYTEGNRGYDFNKDYFVYTNSVFSHQRYGWKHFMMNGNIREMKYLNDSKINLNEKTPLGTIYPKTLTQNVFFQKKEGDRLFYSNTNQMKHRFNSTFEEEYSPVKTIVLGEYFDDIIDEKVNLTLYADHSIILKPGFKTQKGGEFKAVALKNENYPENTFTFNDILDPSGIYDNVNTVTSLKVARPSYGTIEKEVLKSSRLLIDNTSITEEENDIQIYPNPVTNGELNILMNLVEKSRLNIEIIDMRGRRVFKQNISRVYEKGKHTITLNVNKLLPDTYFVKVQTSKGIKTKQIIIQ